jgi:KUP system potassium uptake protein
MAGKFLGMRHLGLGSALDQAAVETNKASPHHSGHSRAALSLAAFGVVYGDIGTSPLYTLKVVLGATG